MLLENFNYSDVFYSFRRFYAECFAPLVADWNQGIQRFFINFKKEGHDSHEVITR